MMQQIRRRIKSKTNGFTLAEAIFSVFITLLVVLILQDLMKSLTLSNKAEHKTDDVVFSYVQFNRFLNASDVKHAYTLPSKSNFKRAVLVKVDKKNQKKIYLLSLYKNMLRATTTGGGHMPLLLNVRTAFFETKDQQIKIKVTESDGRRSEIYFKLDPKPKKKEKNDQDKKIKNES